MAAARYAVTEPPTIPDENACTLISAGISTKGMKKLKLFIQQLLKGNGRIALA